MLQVCCRRPACALARPHRHVCDATPSCLLQGILDTLLEKELPDVPVNDRAMAINALLSSLKLQVGAAANPAMWHGW